MGCLIGILVFFALGFFACWADSGESDCAVGFVLMLVPAVGIAIHRFLVPALRARAEEGQRRREEEDRRRKEEEEEQRKARLERQRKKILDLAHLTEGIIQGAVRDATDTGNSLWLSALLIIQEDFRNLYDEFESGGLSHKDAKARFLDLREQAEVLSTPPPTAGTAGESKKEPTYYEVLGVDPGASQEEITKAFRGKIKQYHPDMFTNQPEWVKEEALRVSKKLNEAYGELSDAKRRNDYDEKIRGES